MNKKDKPKFDKEKILNWSEPKKDDREAAITGSLKQVVPGGGSIPPSVIKKNKKDTYETESSIIEADGTTIIATSKDENFHFKCPDCDFKTNSIEEYQKHKCGEGVKDLYVSSRLLRDEDGDEEEGYGLSSRILRSHRRRRGSPIAASGGVIGMAISTIIVFSVMVPLIKVAVSGIATNITGAEQTVAGLVGLFVILGLMVAAAAMFGLI